MSTVDLDAIRARHKRAPFLTVYDVPDLLAEVERLRMAACSALCRDVEDDRDRLRADLDVMYRVRDDLAAEVERLRAEIAAEQMVSASMRAAIDAEDAEP